MAAEKGSRFPSADETTSPEMTDGGLAASRAIAKARPEDRGPMLRSMIETAVMRLETILDQETAALKQGSKQADFNAFNAQKSLGLIELNRALQLLEGGRPDASTAQLIQRLNTKLEANRQVLKLHMEAVNEVASIISQSIRDAESDGTYTHAFRSKRQTRS